VRPDHISALANLGLAYIYLGKLNDAMSCYQKAL
jgi:hypothetical protein